MNAPRERPILFAGPMVRAILEGRKTQTRRPVNHHSDPELWEPRRPGVWEYFDTVTNQTEEAWPSRYGLPGDRLWVRETWFEEYDPITARPYDPPRACYAATHEGEVRKMDGDGGTVFRKDGVVASPWRPGIHMPRWASRLLLEVTEVRVERLHAITEEDARAEGMEGLGERDANLRSTLLRRWDLMYLGGDFECALDPWVWVVGVRRLDGLEAKAAEVALPRADAPATPSSLPETRSTPESP